MMVSLKSLSLIVWHPRIEVIIFKRVLKVFIILIIFFRNVIDLRERN